MEMESEVSRIDCRLMNSAGAMQHYFTIDRVNINTALVSGITFKMDRQTLAEIMNRTKEAGFRFIQYERPNRTVTYDLLDEKFTEIERKG